MITQAAQETPPPNRRTRHVPGGFTRSIPTTPCMLRKKVKGGKRGGVRGKGGRKEELIT